MRKKGFLPLAHKRHEKIGQTAYRLIALEILYNFVVASTPVSATIKKFSVRHIFRFLYINCFLPRVAQFKFDFNKLPCRFYSI
jgi:hypothetical protein